MIKEFIARVNPKRTTDQVRSTTPADQSSAPVDDSIPVPLTSQNQSQAFEKEVNVYVLQEDIPLSEEEQMNRVIESWKVAGMNPERPIASHFKNQGFSVDEETLVAPFTSDLEDQPIQMKIGSGISMSFSNIDNPNVSLIGAPEGDGNDLVVSSQSLTLKDSNEKVVDLLVFRRSKKVEIESSEVVQPSGLYVSWEDLNKKAA